MIDKAVSNNGSLFIEKYGVFAYPLGMLSVMFFLIYDILGNMLWREYDPVTLYISALTSDIAPNAELIKLFYLLFAICITLMLLVLSIKAIQNYNIFLKAGFIILVLIVFISSIGYDLFPMKGIHLDFSFQNIVHGIITYVTIFLAFVSFCLISIGYKKQGNKNIGNIILSFTVLLFCFGLFYFICIGFRLNILGVVQRLIVYTIMLAIFIVSFYYTFLTTKEDKTVKD